MRILFVVNSGAFLFSHRLSLLQSVLEAGYEVHVAMPQHLLSMQRLEAFGVQVHIIPLQRRGMLPWEECKTVYALYKLYKHLQPDIVQHITIKPIIYGGLVARWLQLHAVVQTVTGLGHVFIAKGVTARLLRTVIAYLYRWACIHPNVRVVVQNQDDQQLLQRYCGVRAEQCVLVPGVGVCVQQFQHTPLPNVTTKQPMTVLCGGRLLWTKGVGEFIQAAKLLKERGYRLRMVWVGALDPGNPASVSEEQLAQWQQQSDVEFWGWCDDIGTVLEQVHIACLPSYREGLPKFLLEAAACGRPAVSTDVPGCRAIVQHEKTGLLVPAQDATALADGLQRLAADPALCQAWGDAGRAMVKARYTEAHINAQMLEIYRELGAHG